MGVGGLLASLLNLYGIFIVIYIVLSWIVATSNSGLVADIYRVLGTICEPYVGLFRRIVPPISVGGGGLDLSPVIALFVLQIVGNLVRGLG